MMNIVAKKIHDRRILRLLRKIVFSLPGGKNLPIGNLTSQWMGNLYLTELDLFIKHNLKCANYLRYSDDFCVFHNDKDFLNNIRYCVDDFVQQNLNLKLSKAIIKPVEGMMFVGFRLFKKFILLRQRTVKKIKCRMRILFQKLNWSDGDIASVASMCGVMGWAKTYNLKK